MTVFAYFFEARSIQDYIVRSDKLADMVAASQIVDQICTHLLPDVLTQLGYSNRDNNDIFSWQGVEFSRGDGGSFNAFFADRDKALEFQALWTLAVSQFAPGLEWIDTLVEGNNHATAADAAFTSLGHKRNQPQTQLPEAGPFVQRAARTGNAATANLDDHRPDGNKGKEWVDRETRRKRLIKGQAQGVAGKFVTDDNRNLIWPRNLEYQADDSETADAPDEKRFPFLPGNRYIGVIHADGNGLGLLLNKLAEITKKHPEHFLTLYRLFSSAVTNANRIAAQAATREVLIPAKKDNTLPARPLVLGGDDLTIIVRADLAIAFTRSFIHAFEKASEQQLAPLKKALKAAGAQLKDKDFPPRLTAAAGIAFVRSSQPFAAAAQLAESICAHVKKTTTVYDNQGKVNKTAIKPSALAFYRPTTSLLDDYSNLLKLETSQHGDDSYCHTLGAYLLSDKPEPTLAQLPLLTHLEALQQSLDNPALSRGPVRELLTLSHESPLQMQQRYQRWRQVLKKGNDDQVKALTTFDSALQAFNTNPEQSVTHTLSNHQHQSPLGDIDTLLAINHHRSTAA